MKRLFIILASVLALAGATEVMASDKTEVHVVATRVLIDDKQVMAPNMQLLPGKTAYVSLSDEDRNPLLSFEMEILPDLEIGSVKGTGLRTRLWNGAFGKGVELMASTLVLSPAPKDAKDPISATVVSADGKKVQVQVISSAVTYVETAALGQARGDCLTDDGQIAGPGEPSEMASGCCGGICSPPGSGYYQCCNVYACCVCGQCCSVP